MKLLSIDSSGKTAAAAVTEGEALLAEGFADEGLKHSQMLLPLIDETLKKAGVALAEIDAFAVTNGPGSFTGLRIGGSLVKGMALGRPCFAVPTLMALAFNEEKSGRTAVALLDARRSQVYLGAYAFENGGPREVIAPCACSVDDAQERLLKLRDPLVLLGDGASFLAHLADGAQILMGEKMHIRGLGVARAAAFLEPAPPEALAPAYYRLSQAEREYQLKHQKGGPNGSIGL